MKGSPALKFKFGVQVTSSPIHDLQLDEINGDHLWQGVMEKDLGSLANFVHIRCWQKGRLFCLISRPKILAEIAHPEIDDSPLVNTRDYSKFCSLVGCANYLITLSRFDIAYATNSFSRFSMQPRQGHIKGMIRVFGYLKKFYKGKILVDPNYPDHSKFDTPEYNQWQEFYPDAYEISPAKE